MEAKMVLIVRQDLKMSKGKTAAQCAHAAVGAYRQCLKLSERQAARTSRDQPVKASSVSSIACDLVSIVRAVDPITGKAAKVPGIARWLRDWERRGQAKVVVRAKGEEELETVCNEARALGIPVSTVRDAGRTEVEAGTVTVAAVGPAPGDLIDRVTGRLALL